MALKVPDDPVYVEADKNFAARLNTLAFAIASLDPIYVLGGAEKHPAELVRVVLGGDGARGEQIRQRGVGASRPRASPTEMPCWAG